MSSRGHREVNKVGEGVGEVTLDPQALGQKRNSEKSQMGAGNRGWETRWVWKEVLRLICEPSSLVVQSNAWDTKFSAMRLPHTCRLSRFKILCNFICYNVFVGLSP